MDKDGEETSAVNTENHVPAKIEPLDYHVSLLFVDVSQLQDTEIFIREIDEFHVQALEKQMNEVGFHAEKGALVVCAADGIPFKVKGRLISSKVDIIDGRHRYEYYKRLAKMDTVPDHINVRLSHIPVHLWDRKDGKQLTLFEKLGIASMMNHTSSTVRKMTFRDRVQAGISVCGSLRRSGVDLKDVTVSTVTSCLVHGHHGTGLSEETIRRYAHVALRMAQSDAKKDIFMAVTKLMPSLGLAHVKSGPLLDSDDVTFFELAMDSVCKRISGKDKNMGNFESFRSLFFNCVKGIYDFVKNACEEKGVSVEAVLQEKVNVSNTQIIPFKEFIANRMARFAPSKDNEKGITSRIRGISRKLNTILESKGMDENVENARRSLQQAQMRREAMVSRVDSSTRDLSRLEATTNYNLPQEPRSYLSVDKQNGETVQDGRKQDYNKDNETERVHEDEAMEHVPMANVDTSNRMDGCNASPKISDKLDERRASERLSKRKRTDEVPVVTDNHADQANNTERERHAQYVRKKATRKRVTDKNTWKKHAVRYIQEADTEEVQELMFSCGYEVNPLELTDEESSDKFADVEDGDVFDDMVPSDPPHGWDEQRTREPVTELLRKKCLNISSMSASSWIREGTKIGDLHTYLEGICIPGQHRSHLFFDDVNFLITNFFQVQWRLLYNYQHCEGLSKVDKSRIKDQTAIYDLLDNEEKIRVHMVLDFEMSRCLAERARCELLHVGYTVVPGALKDIQFTGRDMDIVRGFIPTGSERVAFPDCDWMSKLEDYFKRLFKRFQEDKGNGWKIVANLGNDEDEAEADRGIGRFQTTREAVMEGLERTAETVQLSRMRAYLDIRIAQTLASMGIIDQEKEESEMWIPATGGRWLANGKGLKSQVIHSDYPSMGYRETVTLAKNPGYFAIGTGKEEATLWVVKYSHQIIACTAPKNIGQIGRSAMAVAVVIPPYSIFVGRGDLQHGGSGEEEGCASISTVRYHMYFTPKRHQSVNGIHILKNFRPRKVWKPGEYLEGEPVQSIMNDNIEEDEAVGDDGA